ncbi:BZ3500_MvSof-1268-A1-R1_Chr1-1g00826 [Microbotryum saponariae]|uniref:BZ3500_MvSof-1268-A1-R1_Chr1-1g00826 protein n=1 Tax=Microbotryum saponariae TaxID=289078 RepID=A0A2X0KLR0_9BASI|nr:BZ3500_MvSof-1268-A1-R1_Chr1-1g00826 [Microbotryum saponariae]SCZ92748.1 BZ3501_MvSof-1269-A2-R1_Chr1-1g00423 [Microbotryum saponariae]
MWNSSIVQAALIFAVIVLYSSPVVAWAFCPFGDKDEPMAICSGLCQLGCYEPNSGTADPTRIKSCTGQYHLSRSGEAADECTKQCNTFSVCREKRQNPKIDRECQTCRDKCIDWFIPNLNITGYH